MKLLIMLVLAALSGEAASKTFAVPFEIDRGHIFVKAYVNGTGPYRFGFDTGASGDGRVDASLSSRLSLPKVGEGASTDGVKTAAADLVAVDSLRLGNIEKRELQLLSRDYNGGRSGDGAIMGIIGRDFTAGWLLTIDYPNRLIRLSRGHLRAGDRNVVEYGPSFSVPVCFAEACYPGKVDTGSSRGIVVPKDIAMKIEGSSPVQVGQAKRMNSVATLYQMTASGPARVAGLTLDRPKILYADPSGNSINVGSDFLKDYVLTIDQDRKLLSISRP